MTGQSLGFVWRIPTQFDDPFFRYLTAHTDLDCTVYYFGAKPSTVGFDPEMGRRVGWISDDTRGYRAIFCESMTPSALGRRVISDGHDLIICSGFSHRHTVITALLAKLKGIPVGFRSDNILPEVGGRSRHWRLKKLLYPALFRLYTSAHPVGNQAADYLKAFGFSDESIFLFPYAVDHEWFASESAQARRDLVGLRESWGLPPNADVVCGVVKFSEREDPVTLVRAVQLARRNNPRLVLLLVGDGPLRPQVEEAAGGDLGTSIVLAGYQDFAALPRVYAASDLFVHPAEGPWEVSVTEALACGIPVIASDVVGSAHEIVEPNGFGFTYTYRNPAELASRILRVIDDPQLRNRARQFGLKMLDPFSYAATAERFGRAIQFARGKLHIPPTQSGQ